MLVFCSLFIPDVLAEPVFEHPHLSMHLQYLVHNSEPSEVAAGLHEHGWGTPLQPPIDSKPTKATDKSVRNAYVGDPESVETDNFVIWYGNLGGFSAQNIESLAVEMEHIWFVMIDEMGYPVPEESNQWKFNVYIGDTGEGLPSAEGNAGYFWYDTENYPMMVLSSDIVSWTDSAKLTGGHEFFHAVQASIDTYRFNDSARWWHEATANWILEELYRNEGGYSNTLYSVALRPEIALHHWGDYATEGVEADHHYGAFIFGTFLSEHRGGPDFIQRSFVEAPVNSNPLDVFETLLQENGESLIDAHLEYALRNTTWDYEFESDYEMSVSDYAGGGDSHRSSGTISGISEDWYGPGDWAPHTFGTNAWSLTDLPSEFRIEFEGEQGIRWRVGIAQQDGTQHNRWVMPSNSDSWDILDFDAGDEAWLVVAAVDDYLDDGTTYNYEFRITDVVEEQKGGCTTGSSTYPKGVWWFVFVLFGVSTRRRGKQRKFLR